MNMKKYFNNEEGFSLVELAVAAGIAVFLGAITVSLMPGVMSSTKAKASAYSDCGLKHGNAAMNMIDGIEPTVAPSCTPAPSASQ